MQEMKQIISVLRTTGASLDAIADMLEEMYGSEIKIRLEDVRAVLAEKSRAGYTYEVKALIGKHGASKLSEVPESEYAELLKEAEVIGNAARHARQHGDSRSIR